MSFLKQLRKKEKLTMSAKKTNEAKAKIAADKLIELIVSTKPVATIENDEECYAKPHAEIEIDEDGLCSLCVSPCYPTNPDLGMFWLSVGDVDIYVSCGLEGPKDDYEFAGAEIVYGDGATRKDVIKAIRAHAKFPSLEELQSRYNNTDFDLDDVEESIELDGEVFAEDDEGSIYAFDSEKEIPEGMTAINADEAVHRLVEDWAEFGEVDFGRLYESGPWG